MSTGRVAGLGWARPASARIGRVTNPRRPEVSDLVEVGRGGFGVVYRARQEQFRRDVAVKVITAKLDERARARFTQECRALGQLSGHPHIVPVYDGGVDPDGHGFLIMPFLARGSLADRLTRSGALPWPEATDIGIRLAGALHTAHEAGILHRDLKPGNVLIDEYGAPRLADFGQARFADVDLTRSGEITATPGYAAPEIINGQPHTAQSDVYSLAATIMALILGRSPFDSGDGAIAPVLYRVLSEPPPDLRPLGVPVAVVCVLEAALAKDPAQRPPTALALGIGLQRAQQALGLPVGPLSVAGAQLLPPPLVGAGNRASTLPWGAAGAAPTGHPGAAGPDQTAVSAFSAGLTAALPGASADRPVSPPPARRSRRKLVVALCTLLVAVLAVVGVVVVRKLAAPEPRQNLVGQDLLLTEEDLPGGGWALPESGSSGPLSRFFVEGESLLTCLALPVVPLGTNAGMLNSRDVTVSDTYVDGELAAQTAGIITETTAQAEAITGALSPPGRCPSDLGTVGTSLADSVDYAVDVGYEVVDLPDLPGSIFGAGERIVVPLAGSDTGESTFVVELVFLAAGSAVACAGLVAYGDQVPPDLRASVVEQLVGLLTE